MEGNCKGDTYLSQRSTKLKVNIYISLSSTFYLLLHTIVDLTHSPISIQSNALKSGFSIV